ncbi:MAG: hypothetical protein A3I38_01925 [Candidatus Wildermuthbacteria bacterium RIFCSPLOWO2_02_FULL_47_10]|uniref:Uncharacterized protein n=1 Tax=Candidatus Nomurabacteria bacterium RIFCSPHIGHO2_02_FULL_37_13 TaxID=1801750 RepID=A0A1F6W6P9_9BACT|nr:MAG: hypothetical protein UY15_C0001G0044 [Parcubacteria group bacterium GW2011_GWA2_47_9]OGI77607.1 MAG: hypothetical protein A3B85_02360 [Candidatus Nomurabacteria bacterium RIFCSPHIGHO2_02_FULL_37_13]OGI88096.1 MAG: hypothetical protein A2906_01200 [Candidatus Nomurabacteria bacterium RIFCSPLOWO2_01_FULL_37_25]OHA75863.1 MAG: hypothetical protein A3I38_01925 [Candidatus Wildermuthbacteria bacterium RIFCSPLOWO2_02_FULL_47_10]
MKRKFLTQTEFKQTFQLGQRLTFYEKSPFNGIGNPDRLIFTATHWNESMVIQSATGTAYVCRLGSQEASLKFDVYSLSGTAIFNIKKKDIGYHHTDSLPSFMEEQAKEQGQDWIIHKTSEAIRTLSRSYQNETRENTSI